MVVMCTRRANLDMLKVACLIEKSRGLSPKPVVCAYSLEVQGKGYYNCVPYHINPLCVAPR